MSFHTWSVDSGEPGMVDLVVVVRAGRAHQVVVVGGGCGGGCGRSSRSRMVMHHGRHHTAAASGTTAAGRVMRWRRRRRRGFTGRSVRQGPDFWFAAATSGNTGRILADSLVRRMAERDGDGNIRWIAG